MERFAIIFALGCGALSVLYGLFLIGWITRQPTGSGKMVEIADAIAQGARAYLSRQYRTIAVVAVLMFILLGLGFGWVTAIGFLVGALFSGVAGFVGMTVATKANVRVAEAAKTGMRPALAIAFQGGSVTGLLVAGLGLLAVAGFYAVTHNVAALVGLGFGGSLISIFARLGGGIFTKGADVGADLVGKV